MPVTETVKRITENQIPVCNDIAAQITAGNSQIVGVIGESNIVAGRQDLSDEAKLTYGQSITDGCIGWADSLQSGDPG